MAYTYDPIFAVDPNNTANVARSASITLYDPDDATQSPIAIKDPTGVPLPNPITVDAQGMGPAFQHETLARIAWKGAGFVNYLTSYEGMFNETQSAKEAAQLAANEATSAAAERVTAATVNVSGKLILTKATGATVDAGSVIGPKGDKGDKGADGSNVLPTDAAIKQAIENPSSETRGTLNATYAGKSVEAAVAGKADVRAIRVGTRRRLNAAPIKHMVPANMPGHGWALQTDVSNNASSDLNDTTDFLIGTQALRITTAGTGAYVGWDKTLAAPIDASDCDVRFWFKFEDPDRRLANIQIIVGDSALTWRSTITPFSFSSATSYQQYALQAGRWNILDVPQAAGWTPTGTPNWAAIQRVLVKASDTSGKPITVRLGGVAFTKRDHKGQFPNGVATLTFDDSFGAAYSYGRAKMDQYGYKGTLFPIIDRLGMADKLTLAQIQAMYQNGWDVSGHAFTNANHAIGLTGMTQTQRLAELENIKAWLDTNGFQTQAYAYPLGNHDAASETDVAGYFDCGRLAFLQRDTPQAGAQPYAIQAVNVGSQLASLNTFITRAVAGKGWVNFIVHDIKASGATGNDINQADFDTLLANLASSGIAVRTMSEVLATIA